MSFLSDPYDGLVLEDAMAHEAHAGVAWRKDLPVLTFGLLLLPEGDGWTARSVLTSHVARGRTSDGAFATLTATIDTALQTAEDAGMTAVDWYESQAPDEVRFLRMFVALAKERKVLRLSGGVTIEADVAKAA